jgi:hypothetical protein
MACWSAFLTHNYNLTVFYHFICVTKLKKLETHPPYTPSWTTFSNSILVTVYSCYSTANDSRNKSNIFSIQSHVYGRCMCQPKL